MKTALVLLILLGSTYSVGSDRFHYTAQPSVWSEKGKLFYAESKLRFNLVDNTMILKDAVMPSFSCGSDTAWMCINNSYLNFAIKRKWTVLPDKWGYEDFSYEKLSSGEVMILGRRYKVQVVVVKERTAEPYTWNIVYYSRLNGILMFHVYDGESDQLSTFISSNKKGLFSVQG